MWFSDLILNFSEIKSITKFVNGEQVQEPYPFTLDVYQNTLIEAFKGEKEINIATLYKVRDKFITMYYEKGYDKTYPNILFAYNKAVMDAGHSEAYNYWLFQLGNEDEFDAWHSKNTEKWDAFTKWFDTNPLVVNEANNFRPFQYVANN